MIESIERLRALLTARVAPTFTVSRKRTQYAAAEDSEFFTDIDVQHAVDGFVLGIGLSRGEESDAFHRRVLHRYIPELWFVDDDRRRVITSRRGHEPVIVEGAATLRSVQLPSITIDLADIFEL